MNDQRSRGAAFCLLVALICGSIYYYIGYRILTGEHPAEDAYILFRYADHLAQGHGIVFNIGGPRAEGATDFLWLLLLAAGVRLGGDVALVALALNAIGAGLAGWLLGRCCWGPPHRPLWVRAALCMVLPMTCFAGGAEAGYWGFSSMLYSALIFLLFVLAAESQGRTVGLVPFLGLTVAFFRPDGVVVGVAFTLLGLWTAWSERQVHRYVTASLICAVLGIAYFVWRWNYFGLPLPLPLYVKQNADQADVTGLFALLPGLSSHGDWFFDRAGPRLIVLGLLAALIYSRGWRDDAIKRMLVCLLPLIALLAIFALAVPTQNIRFRFQAPTYLVLVYMLVSVVGRVVDSDKNLVRKLIVLALMAAAVLPSERGGLKQVRWHRGGKWKKYLDVFATRFGPVMDPRTVVALTEAGAVPYWTRAQVADIVGLNDPEAAVRPPTVQTLKELDPDLVFLHQGTSLNNDVLAGIWEEGDRIRPITRELLDKAFLPSRRKIVDRGATRYRDIPLMNVQYAPSVMIQYLIESPEYDIFVVDPTGIHSFVHVFGLKKEWHLRDEALESLTWSLEPENYRSYLTIRHDTKSRARR